MSVFKRLFTRSIIAVPNPDVDIPSPNQLVSGNITSINTNQLIDNTIKVATKVSVGDIVYNTSNYNSAYVLGTVGDHTLILSQDIFAVPGETYTVYQQSQYSGLGNTGAILFNGDLVQAQVICTSISGDEFTYMINPSDICPIQVVRLKSSLAPFTSIIAMW